ncbi:hypothetical protein INT45_001107 [Circinella minor]|uniref:Uncharacterized protein n=1 Tax=Circinella minor TaxID=1195481 RepID=A0A8H7V513_9FUNG|nr:hypothetical protein INT45_001107 [Circinella minor]
MVFEQLIKKYGSNAPHVEAIMAFVIRCSTALKWKITQQDIAKIKSFFKRHVKSHVLPGANAGNIIKRQLLTCNFERVYKSEEVTEEQPEGDTYTIMDYLGIELWEARDSIIGNGDECFNIESYLRNYWNNQFDQNDNHVMSRTLSEHIKIERHLFVNGVVYTCEQYPSASKKLDTLLRFVLPTSIRGVTGTYFGKVIMYFSHIFEEEEHPLCLVKLYGGVTCDEYGTSSRKKKGTPHVYRRPDGATPADKTIVAHVENIKEYSGMLKSSAHTNRFYLIYPDMCPGEVVETDIAKV